MKIVCDACQAKYSISDDKVQGKVFKIRCKKCSNIIVVRGGAGATESAPPPQQEKDTRVYDYGYEGGDHAPAGDEAVWHVVINQDQVGPMTAVEVQQRFASGEIDAETYIWREGFTDWLPLTQVDAFASLAASGGSAGAAAPVPRSGPSPVAARFGAGGADDTSGRSDPGDLFAAASAGAAAQQDDDGGDLFGSKPSAAQANQANAKLRGERNENSVLFSLNNLAQLASNKPAPAPANSPMSPSGAGAATGAAGGEGSGLIDIRSMASAYLGGGGGGPAKPVSAGVGSMDDLPVFGGGGFSEPAVIVPMSSRSNTNKLMYALIGSVGLLALAAVIVVVVLVKGNGGSKNNNAATQVASADDKAGASEKGTEPETPGAKGTDSKTPDPGAEPKATEPKATEPKPAEPRPTDPKASEPSAGKAPASEAPSEPKHTAPTPAHRPPTPATPSRTPKQPEKAAAPPPPKDAPAPKDSGGGGCDEVSCVLNNYEGACCAKFKKGGKGGGGGKPAGGGSSDLPDALDRSMISEGVGRVKARVISCGEKSSAKGMVKVSVKVGPDGHVANVSIKTSLDPAIDGCVESAMQKATFAKTQTGGSFAYPFTF